MNRRRFLKAAAAPGLAAAVAGCSSDEDSTPETRETPGVDGRPPNADRFETVVDMGDAGADATGERSAVPVIAEHIADDTLLYFPEGRYLFDETVQRLAFENIGIVGPDAVVVPEEGFNGVFFDLGRPGRASHLLFEGLTFDFRAPTAGSRPLSALVDDGLDVRDIDVTGRQSGGSGMLRVDVTDDAGTGVVERARFPDGAEAETQANGCLVGDRNRGEIRFIDCHIEGFPDNGLYADPDEGSVRVIGGYYANCNVSCVRVGNDSLLRGVRVRCDTAPEEYGNMRGIRLTNAREAVIEDCVVEMERVTGSDGAITLGKALVSATVRNTDIVVDADGVNAIQIKHPEDAPADERIRFEDVNVTGSAANSAAIEAHERADCLFRGVTIEQDGTDRDGFLFDNADGTLRDCRIDVTGDPLVVSEGSSVSVTGTVPVELNDDAESESGRSLLE